MNENIHLTLGERNYKEQELMKKECKQCKDCNSVCSVWLPNLQYLFHNKKAGRPTPLFLVFAVLFFQEQLKFCVHSIAFIFPLSARVNKREHKTEKEKDHNSTNDSKQNQIMIFAWSPNIVADLSDDAEATRKGYKG